MKQHMSKEEKAQAKRSCYSCQEREHMAHSCPLGEILSLFQLIILTWLEKMVMVPLWLLLQNILLLILRHRLSMLHRT